MRTCPLTHDNDSDDDDDDDDENIVMVPMMIWTITKRRGRICSTRYAGESLAEISFRAGGTHAFTLPGTNTCFHFAHFESISKSK
jgi:hypothetical protein